MILGDVKYNMMFDGFVRFMLLIYVKILSMLSPDNYSQMVLATEWCAREK